MSSAHTKGPWIAKAGDTFDGDIAITTEGRIAGSMVEIAAICTDWDEPFASEQLANVRLIVAAPDLFDIVQTIGKLLDEGELPSLILDENSPICDAIREAIAKAAGGAA